VRGSGVVDPVIVEPVILESLELYIQTGVEEIPCIVAKFLNMFILESPFLESFEVDNFILRNGKIVSLWYVLLPVSLAMPAFSNDFSAWTTYNIQRQDLALVRTNLLLRSLLVDSEHLQDIIQAHLDPSSSPFEGRYCVNYLESTVKSLKILQGSLLSIGYSV